MASTGNLQAESTRAPTLGWSLDYNTRNFFDANYCTVPIRLYTDDLVDAVQKNNYFSQVKLSNQLASTQEKTNSHTLSLREVIKEWKMNIIQAGQKNYDQNEISNDSLPFVQSNQDENNLTFDRTKNGTMSSNDKNRNDRKGQD